MHSVQIALEERALLELQAVLLDNDPAAALAFVRRHIVPQLPRRGSAPCDSSRLNPFLLTDAQLDATSGGDEPPDAT